MSRRLPNKLQDALAYPPRAMKAERAAAYLDMSRTKFLELVDQGRSTVLERKRSMVRLFKVPLLAAETSSQSLVQR